MVLVDGNIHQVVYSVHVSNEQGSRRAGTVIPD